MRLKFLSMKKIQIWPEDGDLLLNSKETIPYIEVNPYSDTLILCTNVLKIFSKEKALLFAKGDTWNPWDLKELFNVGVQIYEHNFSLPHPRDWAQGFLLYAQWESKRRTWREPRFTIDWCALNTNKHTGKYTANGVPVALVEVVRYYLKVLILNPWYKESIKKALSDFFPLQCKSMEIKTF